MKKLFITICCAFAAFSLSAQDTETKKLDVGFRFTPLISGVRSIDSAKTVIKTEGASGRMGYNVGLMANYNFTPNFSFHTGLGYVNYGYNVDNSVVKLKAARSAVEIPTAFRLRTPEVGGMPIHVRLLAGVNHYILVGASTTTTIKALSTTTTSKSMSDLSPYHLGILAGLGADWKIDKVGIIDIGFRMNKGITEISKNNLGKNTMNYYGIDLGYYFNW
jgi:hypothetical protein